MPEPMESAPRDGTPIIGIYEDSEVEIRWSDYRK